MGFEVIYKICIIISCLFEIYLVMDFYSAFHEYRSLFLSPVRRFLTFVLWVCVNIGINFQNNSFLNLILIPVLYLCMLFILFRGEIKTYLLHWLLATFIMFASEFIFLVLQRIPMNVPTDELFTDPFVMLSSIFAVKLLSFILMLIVKQMSIYSQERFSINIFGNYIVVPISTLGAMWVIPYVRGINNSINLSDIILVLFYILMLIGNIRLFYMFVQYNCLKKKELEKEVALAKYREKEWYFSEKKQIEQQQKVLIHNIKHYLSQIGRYAAKGEDEEIIETVKDLQVEFLENESKVICANSLLNSILMDWKKSTVQSGIEAIIFVETGFNIEFMRRIDIMAVFGNLLDNAREAAEKCENGKVEVQLFMQNDGAFSIICIRNNYIGKIQQKEEGFVSTKKEGQNHGIGIKNVREIIESYGGYIQINYLNQIYETTIMIPISEKDKFI